MVDFNIIPMREPIGDRLGAYRVVRLQVGNGLVGKDDTPAEGHAARVALEDVKLVGWIAQLH